MIRKWKISGEEVGDISSLVYWVETTKKLSSNFLEKETAENPAEILGNTFLGDVFLKKRLSLNLMTC
ncbi:MAG: hypothetical protein ABS916_08520 [Carnobacterium sp.]|mgnify:CR=1 FL=1|uniref:hypothetical protein n=1 Tax=Carnobacterium sp. TaxID=48221 RepID=UPI00331614DF